ncbi:MAG: tetratricopeptide repeat protein [Proteobacteria bacterium]|nr:tetratricopeptide repeat protein [Pseudomonadota bacterium]
MPATKIQGDFAAAAQLHQAGRLAEAEAIYQSILACAPAHADALRLLGVLKHQSGDHGAAVRLIRQAIAHEPGNAKAHGNLGYVLSALGRKHDALGSLAEGAALAPTDAATQFNHASLLAELGRDAEAIPVYRRAVELAPGNVVARLNLGVLLLKAHAPREALSHLDAALAAQPTDSALLANRCIALCELGHRDELARLADLETLVRPAAIGAARGYPNLAAFNVDLADYVATNVTLREQQTTVHGLDTKELFDTDRNSARALKAFIEAQIAVRLKSLPADPTHPFARGRPAKYRIESWGVKMWRQGFQVAHIHYKAWLSGVYYVQLPEVVRDDEPNHQGWISFGRGPDDLYATTSPPTRLVRPVEGMLITFPSYTWHRTIPFDGVKERISIAFDVIPIA